jgi:hypothetical protein
VAVRVVALQSRVPHPFATVLAAVRTDVVASGEFAEFLRDQLAPLGHIS